VFLQAISFLEIGDEGVRRFLRTFDDCEIWVWCERGGIAGEDGDGVVMGEGLGEDEAAVAACGSGDEDVHFN
jgi:hypothetical protein